VGAADVGLGAALTALAAARVEKLDPIDHLHATIDTRARS
jgi:hypothetical protein